MGERLKLSLACTIASLTCCLEAGTIKGPIQTSPPKNDEAQADEGAYQSRRYKFLEQIDYESLKDFVVSLDAVEHTANDETGRPRASVAQRDGTFEPHVTAIAAGSQVEWHERLPTKYIEIEVPENGALERDIEMGLADLPKI